MASQNPQWIDQLDPRREYTRPNGVEIAFDSCVKLSEYYRTVSQAYRAASGSVTKQQMKESGKSRKYLARHYRQMGKAAEQKSAEYERKANRWLQQL